MNHDGSGRTMLTNSGYSPSWSPDSSAIAFYSGTDAVIYVINADGTGKTQLTTGGRDFNPSWSPSPTPVPTARPSEGDAW